MADGLTRPEATVLARSMLGEEAVEEIDLPAFELPLIRLIGVCHNRWHWVSAGVAGASRVAFDLPAVEVAARWLGIDPDARLMSGLAILEREALKLLRIDR